MVLPEGMTTIEAYVFAGCTALTKIWIDQEVTSIGNNVFENCSNLTIHGIENSYAQEYAETNGIPFSTELMVYPSVNISGVVQDENGSGVAGVTVTLYDATRKEIQETLKTNDAGEWSSTEVFVDHEYKIWFYHTDYTFDLNEYTVIVGEEDIEFQTVVAIAKENVP